MWGVQEFMLFFLIECEISNSFCELSVKILFIWIAYFSYRKKFSLISALKNGNIHDSAT